MARNWSSAALFLLLTSTMLVKSSNYVGPIMLLLASLLTWRVQSRERQPLPREFRWFLITLYLLAASWILDGLLSGHGPSSLDRPLKIFLLLPCATYLLWQPPRAFWLWASAALGAIACGLVGIYHVQILHYQRAGHTYINPIEFGDTCTQLALISLCGTQTARQYPRRLPFFLLMIAGFTLGMTGSILSGTRGAWLAGLIALAFLSWWYIGRYSKRLLAALLLAMGMSVVLIAHYAPVGERLQAMRREITSYRQQGNAATSVGARIQMWQFATELSMKRPLSGWTQKGYDEERLRQVEQGRLNPFLAEFNHPHNDYLDASAKRGIFGLIVLLACHLSCFVYFWRAMRRKNMPPQGQALCLVGMLLPLLFASFGLTDTHIIGNRTIVMYFYLAAFMMALVEKAAAPTAALAFVPPQAQPDAAASSLSA